MTVTNQFRRVEPYVGDVTNEQIDKCTRIVGPDQKIFWAVQNERGETFEGEILTYQVRYSREEGFTCTCRAGAAGFANVRHPSGVCKHCRWVVAAILEERAYFAELAAGTIEERPGKPTPPAWYNPQNQTSFYDGTRAELLIVDGDKEADEATYTRVMEAKPRPQPEARGDFSSGFNLMR